MKINSHAGKFLKYQNLTALLVCLFDDCLTARDEQRGQDAVRQLKTEGATPIFHQLDIVSPESIEKMKTFLLEKYGGLDLLVNNAGVAYKVCSPLVLYIPD